jgi:Rrf2 family iron-sulfur cluster assembly transcriptional regulator
MRLTTKGRYAVTAMLDLSLNYDLGSITLADISERQSISLSYLEQLFSKLRKHKLVSSARGPGGGYKLSRPAVEITVFDVISAVDENIDNTACKHQGNCREGNKCLSHHLWCSLSEQIRNYLSGISLEQVMLDYQDDTSNKNTINLDSL